MAHLVVAQNTCSQNGHKVNSLVGQDPSFGKSIPNGLPLGESTSEIESQDSVTLWILGLGFRIR